MYKMRANAPRGFYESTPDAPPLLTMAKRSVRDASSDINVTFMPYLFYGGAVLTANLK